MIVKTSCIQHPKSSRFMQLHVWQVAFCENDHCAALLLSHFSCWHDWKLTHDAYYRRYNDIAEAHGDERLPNEQAYLFFTMEDLLDALMGLFGKKSIQDGLEHLVSLGVISIHKNPNPRYHFDKTKYFKFYPEVCNDWLATHTSTSENKQIDAQVVDNFDNPKVANAFAKNGQPSRKNGRPSRKNGQAITDTTNNTTNKNQSINAREEKFSVDESIFPDVMPIVNKLIEKGMAANKFYIDSINKIHELKQQGARLEDFIYAYQISERVTQEKGFGLNYLLKVVKDQIQEKKMKHTPVKDCFKHTLYEDDIRNALAWMKEEEICS